LAVKTNFFDVLNQMSHRWKQSLYSNIILKQSENIFQSIKL